jgi:pimeloyl-ACP methyl ester carboxylesterase
MDVVTIASDDGTSIGSWVSGSGPPLLMVHGTTNDHSSFRFVEPILAERFRVVAMDRRGRGASSDRPDAYAIEREIEDVVALVESHEEPVYLFGHSFGASVAIGAAAQATNLRRVVLYEPTPGVPNLTPSELDGLRAMLADGDLEGLLRSVLVDVAGMSAGDFDSLRSSEVWPARLATAPTIIREFVVEEAWHVDADLVSKIEVPVLFLLGTESPAFAREATEMLHSWLPDSRIQPLEGQGHVATVTAPQLLADAIVRFAIEDERSSARR